MRFKLRGTAAGAPYLSHPSRSPPQAVVLTGDSILFTLVQRHDRHAETRDAPFNIDRFGKGFGTGADLRERERAAARQASAIAIRGEPADKLDGCRACSLPHRRDRENEGDSRRSGKT